MAQVKGTFLINRFRYLEEKGTPEDKEKVIALVNPELQKKIRAGLLAVKWYKVSDYVDLIKALKKVMGPANDEFFVELGRFSADIALNGLYKMFMKIGSVEMTLKKVPNMWKQLVDSGALVPAIIDKNHATITIENFNELSEEFCEALRGWMIGAFEICGAKNISVSFDKINLATATSMPYHCQWS